MNTLLTQEFLRSNAGELDEQRRKLYQLGIKTSYDDKRMIFSTLHTQKNTLSNVYTQECNGLILEIDSWRPLMVPPRSLRFSIGTDEANRYLHQGLYHIFASTDGTTFHMYYYDNRWVISTTKGYDMNEVKWEGLTYQELVTDCLRACSPAGSEDPWSAFTAALNPTRCYSFIFRHPRFHHFNREHRLQFIQYVDLDPASSGYLWAFDESPVVYVTKQALIEHPVNNLRDLYRLANGALDDFLATGAINYGYILRSVNFETTGFHSDLVIESSLQRAIRKTWNDAAFVTTCRQNGWNLETAVCLKEYLNNEHEVFLTLYPWAREHFDRIAVFIRGLVDCIIKPDPSSKLNATAVSVLTWFNANIKYDLQNKNYEQKVKILTEVLISSRNFEALMAEYVRV